MTTIILFRYIEDTIKKTQNHVINIKIDPKIKQDNKKVCENYKKNTPKNYIFLFSLLNLLISYRCLNVGLLNIYFWSTFKIEEEENIIEIKQDA